LNAFQVVRDFEKAVAEYTGAPYCVAVNSCTMALLLACKYLKVGSHDPEADLCFGAHVDHSCWRQGAFRDE
jgi:dTDP-4-amino-4,6-dideoxygalactose transaminase